MPLMVGVPARGAACSIPRRCAASANLHVRNGVLEKRDNNFADGMSGPHPVPHSDLQYDIYCYRAYVTYC